MMMVVLVICKIYNDSIKTAEAIAIAMAKLSFYLYSRASNSVMKSLIWLKFELIQDFLVLPSQGQIFMVIKDK